MKKKGGKLKERKKQCDKNEFCSKFFLSLSLAQGGSGDVVVFQIRLTECSSTGKWGYKILFFSTVLFLKDLFLAGLKKFQKNFRGRQGRLAAARSSF